jgi:hypothetical protein
MHDTGPQYRPDDAFKAAARLHQSEYRSRVLRAGFTGYGNRLCETDARALLNYYDGLGIREAVTRRFPAYSGTRDADMLRSEHIPFNLLAPLAQRTDLLVHVLADGLGLELGGPLAMEIEWAPAPACSYLDDLTSFDTYIRGAGRNGEKVGIGIEVKYTERRYRIGRSEAMRVRDPQSRYWLTTRQSRCFRGGGSEALATDELRQIWRNHLLGLAMVQRHDIDRFISVTLYPSGNRHFTKALTAYRHGLEPHAQDDVLGWTFEQYISALRGNSEIEDWKRYLAERYLVSPDAVREG